jgi:hydroxymethylglutaryl-CoA lyase
MSELVSIVEVGPRDGFQSVADFIPTATKTAIISQLYDAGIRRIEATSFVSAAAVPQLADGAEVLNAIKPLALLDAQVLVPTAKQAARALTAGANHFAFVLSVSEQHNRANVRRSPQESTAEFARVVDILVPDMPVRLNVATAFDCPYEGPLDPVSTLDILEPLIEICARAEVALCDTTGRVTPKRVGELFRAAQLRYPQVPAWAFHGHDTFGMAAANAFAAWNAGVRVFDASIAGLGGCPFAPGATGNVATEDLVWMFEAMGLRTGLDLDGLIEVARYITTLPGAQIGGRVRDAMKARRPDNSRDAVTGHRPSTRKTR